MNVEDSRCFIDSNIWLYALLDMQETGKQDAAKSLIQQQSNIVISTQVINEVSRNLLRTDAFTEPEIIEFIESAYHLLVDDQLRIVNPFTSP